MASELAANAIAHTASGFPGGIFEVRVAGLDDGQLAIFVADQGGPTLPAIKCAGVNDESGRGLDLIASLASVVIAAGDGGTRGVLALLTY